MPNPPQLTQQQREVITAALFRREAAPTIAQQHNISERQVRRMHFNLRTYGTVTAPRLRKMGRPTVLTTEIEEDLKQYVSKYPLALLEDMQKHIQTTFGVTCSRASLSRRMADLGFSRGMIRRGFRASETGLPTLSQVDYDRIRKQQEEVDDGKLGAASTAPSTGQNQGRSPVEGEMLSNGNAKKTKYAWLTEGEPVKKPKWKKDGSQSYTHATGDNATSVLYQNHRDANLQPDLESPTIHGHEQGAIYNLDLRHLSAAAEQELARSPIQPEYPPIPERATESRSHYTGEGSEKYFGLMTL